MRYSINLAKKIELILLIPVQSFSKKIYIEEKCKAIKIAKKTKTCTNLFFDRTDLN